MNNPCHRCEHQNEIQAGLYRGSPWEKTPCARCDFKDRSSVYTICYDESRGADSDLPDGDVTNGGLVEQGDAESVGLGSVSTETVGEEAEACLPISVLVEFVSGLLCLTPKERDVVCLRYQGHLYRTIAKKQGVSVAAVEHLHRRAMRRWPALRELFLVKARKETRRKHGLDPVEPKGKNARSP